MNSPKWLDLLAYFVNVASVILPVPDPDEMPYFNFFPRYDFHILPD